MIDISDKKLIIFDFDGIFTDNKVYTSSIGEESVSCNRSDGLGIKMLKNYIFFKKIFLDIFILSSEVNQVVKARSLKLGLNYFQGIGDKAHFTDTYLKNKNLKYDDLVYLGNDLNDLILIKKAGLSIVPADSHPLLLKNANVVLGRNGGDGFVRQFVEEVLDINNLNLGEIHELVSYSGDRNKS